MRPTPILAAAVTIGLAAAPPLSAAPARPASPPARPVGNVTRAQMQAEVDAVFRLADADSDGYMTRAEFGKRMAVVLNRTPPGSRNAPTPKQAQDMLNAANAAFKAVDSNDDGRLTAAEAARRPMRAFDMVDANHDGILTVAEKIAARRPGAGAIATPPAAPERKAPAGR